MMKKLSRRFSLKLAALGALFGFVPRNLLALKWMALRIDRWDKTHDRVWLGSDFWANPMEDWLIADGWAECQTNAENRSIHSLTHQLTKGNGNFEMSVRVGNGGKIGEVGGAGFRLGIRSELNEFKSNCFAKGGLNAGVLGDQIVLAGKRQKLGTKVEGDEFVLTLTGTSKDEGSVLKLVVTSPAGETLGSISQKVPAEQLLGNVAVVSQFKGPKNRGGEKGYRFTEWKVGGDAFTVTAENQFGPILWSMYTLSDSRGDDGFVMKMSALTGPMGGDDSHEVELEVKRGDTWESLGSAKLDSDAWTATFRIPKWKEKIETPYRLSYREKLKDGSEAPSEWTGTIKPNPEGRALRLGALTCQNDYGFPYAPVAENLIKLNPDMLYFSGDQIYESHGGFGIIRDPAEPAILCYLRKFYQFGWSFREAMKDSPTVCLPDDHDVFQGNIWGEGGAAMKDLDAGASSKGGYREPARMVNAVHRTNTAHHPDPFDPTASEQEISVYYGDLVYGGVSFAILAPPQTRPDRRPDKNP